MLGRSISIGYDLDGKLPTESWNATCWPYGAAHVLAEIEDVCGVIADTLLEIDDIELQVNPQIEAEYALKIGCWENELLKAQFAARRAKRRAELAQVSANAGNLVDEEALGNVLDAEFAAWEAAVKSVVETYIVTIERREGSEPMSVSEAHELKRLRRILIKRLHQDLRPGEAEAEKRMFLLAQGAFETGDIATLRSLEVATATNGIAGG